MSKSIKEKHDESIILRTSARRWMNAYWGTLFAALLTLALGKVFTDSPAVMVIYAIMMISSVGFFVRSVILTYRYENLQRSIWNDLQKFDHRMQDK